jgi:hypothetical protein
LAAEIEAAVGDLSRAHSGFNNFYNEPSYARALLKLIPDNGRVPVSVEYEYVKVLLLCRIGNGHGISEAGRPHYDELINRWSERHVIAMIRLLADDREVESRLQFQMCRTNLKQLAEELAARISSSSVRRALGVVTGSSDEQLPRLRTRMPFKQADQAMPQR